MTEDDQIAICKAIAVSCMWGQGGIAAVILERLDKKVPAPASWRAVYSDHAKGATREYIGDITDEAELIRRIDQGGWLVNFDEDGCDLFGPPPMNGLEKHVSKELADKYRHGVQRYPKIPGESLLRYSGAGDSSI